MQNLTKTAKVLKKKNTVQFKQKYYNSVICKILLTRKN